MPWGEADEEARREEGKGAAAKREKEDSVREGRKERRKPGQRARYLWREYGNKTVGLSFHAAAAACTDSQLFPSGHGSWPEF